jgi:hypothetical protein
MCRGNNRSAWIAAGGYEATADKAFNSLQVDRFLLEYDTERAGGFEPLRFVPRGKTVVLGLISSKEPQLESQDLLRRRIDEAARYVPIENLALSPQCGFASTAPGNLLTWDEQRRKLELVVETARRCGAKAWGIGEPARALRCPRHHSLGRRRRTHCPLIGHDRPPQLPRASRIVQDVGARRCRRSISTASGRLMSIWTRFFTTFGSGTLLNQKRSPSVVGSRAMESSGVVTAASGRML